MRPIDTGAVATVIHVVTDTDCATNWGNDLPVLATPVLLWLAEIASMKIIDANLDDDEMTVGFAHTAQHLAATPVGWNVEISATLTRIEGRLAYFDVIAKDRCDTIFSGEHVRAIIGRTRFINRLEEKTATERMPA